MSESQNKRGELLLRKAELAKRKKRLHRRRKLLDWGVFTGYLLPSLAGVLLFFFLPLLMLLKTSFQKSPTNSDFVGFANYGRVITNSAFVNASKNTLTFALISVPLAIVLSLLVALLLNSGMPGKSIFRSILLNPMMVPVASIVLIWQVFFSYNGVINGWFASLFGMNKIDWLKSSYAQIVIFLMFIWKNLGYNMVLFLAALNNIPTEVIESAKMDGAGPVKRFFSIKMHYLSSTIFFVGIMSLINSFKIFREVYLLTGDYPFASALYEQRIQAPRLFEALGRRHRNVYSNDNNCRIPLLCRGQVRRRHRGVEHAIQK